MLENESRLGCSSANGDSMLGLFTDFSIENEGRVFRRMEPYAPSCLNLSQCLTLVFGTMVPSYKFQTTV